MTILEAAIDAANVLYDIKYKADAADDQGEEYVKFAPKEIWGSTAQAVYVNLLEAIRVEKGEKRLFDEV